MGIMSIRPSGRGTSRPFLATYVFRRWSFEPMTSSRSPSSRIRSSAPRLLRDETVGAGFEHAALDALGIDHSAETSLALDQCATEPLLRQIVGRRQAGNPTADDRYTGHSFCLAASASARMKLGESFSDSGRRKVIPRSQA